MCVNNVLAAIIHVYFCLVGDLRETVPKRAKYTVQQKCGRWSMNMLPAIDNTYFMDHGTNTLKFNKTVLSHTHSCTKVLA